MNTSLASLATLDSMPVQASYSDLPVAPDGQVYSTIDLMRKYVMEDSQFPYIVDTAQSLQLQIHGGTPVAQAIHDRANEVLNFTLDTEIAVSNGLDDQLDPQVVEVLTRPADVEILYRRTGQKVNGDCDDFSMYSLALAQALANLGEPIDNLRFVTIAAEPGNPNFSHVYTRINVNNCSTAIDASHGPEAGWEAAGAAHRLVEHPVGSSMGFVQAAGLVAVGFILWGLWRNS
jgi:hypothetical protein